MLSSSSWCTIVGSTTSSVAALAVCRRHYTVIRKGQDVQQPTLFHTLGFGKDDELRMTSRTTEELKLGFVREAKRLEQAVDQEPSLPGQIATTPKQKQDRQAKKMKALKSAFHKLKDPIFRSQYVPYHCSSVDANLHVLCEGGQHCTNYNPEHETLDFTSMSQLPHRSFGDFKEAFQQASHTASGKAAAYDAATNKLPQDGPDIQVSVHLNFQEAMDGCVKTVLVRRFTTCKPCLGSGDQHEKRPRKCPQCGGNGTITLPSVNYVVKKPCDHCVGRGTLPAPACRSCRGSGTNSIDDVVAVQVTPGSHTGQEQRIVHKGQAGIRGGKTGNLIVTYLVEEHRWFHRIGLDLHIALPVPLSTALLGGFVQVPLLDGQTKSVHIPPNLKNGEIVNVDKGGIKAADGTVGMLRIHAIVVIPRGESLTGSQRHALRLMTEEAVTGSNSGSMSFEEAKKAFRNWLTD